MSSKAQKRADISESDPIILPQDTTSTSTMASTNGGASYFGFDPTTPTINGQSSSGMGIRQLVSLDSLSRLEMSTDELDELAQEQLVVIRKYPLQCYRLDAANNAVATEERKGKYSGAVAELDGRQVPHGVGTFKTSTGYMWTGSWADGVPHDTLGKEILDGLPTAEDPLLGGDIRGHYDRGKPTSYDKTRSLEERLHAGDYEQSVSMQDVGLYGQSAMLPGHKMSKILSPVIYGTIVCAAAGLIYWISQVELDWSTKDAFFTGPAFLLAFMVFFFAKSNYEAQQHRIWGCMHNMICAWGCSASGHFWIAGMIYSGEFTDYDTGVLTLPFGFMQLGATITMLIHSVGATYGIPASWQMVKYEKKKARTIARGETFHEIHHWWSDGSAIGSPFIVLLDSPMNNWERVLLYVWYFVFGFGQLAMFVYLEMSGPTPEEELRARYVDKETAFRFRWVLLVSGIGGVLQFFMALLHLDANVQKKWALTQNLLGVTAFCIESVPLLANTFITLHVFLNPYYTFEDMVGLATAQVATAMFCIIVMLVQLYIEAREARKRADGLVAEDMDRYNACWEDVSSGAEASATLMRIRRLCAEAKHAAGRAYTNDPIQRLSNLDSSHKKSYSIFYKLLSLAGALNRVVQDLGRRWSEEAGATSTAGFHEAPVKTAKRAIEKVWRSYNGNPACLTDIVRTSIVCSSLEELERVAKAVFCDTLVQVIRVKNRFDPDYDSTTTAGYRDISMNLKLTSKDGEHTEQIFEVQIQLQAFYNLKSDKGHAKYAQFRDLRGA